MTMALGPAGVPYVSIIVRAFNEAKFIGELFEACVAQQTDFPFEIILVDSGSDDATLDIAARYPVKIVQIEKSRFSFGRALNLGIENACGEICVIVSAHCKPIGYDWLANMVTAFADDKIGMVYGKQRGDERSQYSELQLLMQWFPEETIERTEFAFCNNANSAIRRSLWQVEKFNEDLTGLEDLDWAKRIVAKGYFLSYRADAGVYHIHEENVQQVHRRYYREALAYREIYPHHRFSWLQFVVFFILNALSDFAHAIVDGCFWREVRSIVSFRYQQFHATYEAHQLSNPLRAEMQRRLYYPRNPKELMRARGSSGSALNVTPEISHEGVRRNGLLPD